MALAPSVSSSITVRLEVASRGRAVSAITRAGEQAGGVFRGLLDAQRRLITDDMLIAAAQALADVVSPDEIGPHYIIPSVFHPDVTSAGAVAVAAASTRNAATHDSGR